MSIVISLIEKNRASGDLETNEENLFFQQQQKNNNQ